MRAFETLVAEALDHLPISIRERMENVAVVVEEWPRPTRLTALGYDPDESLLGLYEGIPRHQRGSGYHLAVPDRITIFRQPILDQAGSGGRDAIVHEVRKTVIHEVAHHFGIDDEELARLEGDSPSLKP
jgi:predicted Zn-dependent protease with MMP-like domain